MTVTRPVTCPSGLHLTVREMTGQELQDLMDTPDDQIDGVGLLAKCITAVPDPGPIYQHWKKGDKCTPVTDELLVGDATVAMIGVRIATYNEMLDVDLPCPYCRHPNNYTINLAELPVKKMDDEAIKRLLNNDPFVTPVRGTNIKWLPARQSEQKNLNKQSRLDPSKTVALGASLRVREIEGVHDNDKLTWLSKLGLGTLEAFMEVCDYFDGGIETTQQFRCGSPSCLATVTGEIPLDRRLFLKPKAKWKKTGARPDPSSAIG